MKQIINAVLGFWLLGTWGGRAADVVYLDHHHMDFRIEYNPAATGSNQLDIALGYDSGVNHFTVQNQLVYIVGNPNARLTIPSNPNYAFLGSASAPVWVLPQSQNVTLPYVGISAEDVPNGVFEGPITLELRSVEGPGNFFVWSVSGAGQPPTVKMICTNGIVSPQYNSTAPLIGSHEHFNWGFSTNGLYRVTFRCTGTRLGESTNIVGKEVAWAFQILPLRPWENWASTNWLPATAPNIAGVSADPDGDGVANLLEYAFGTDPNVALRTNLPTCVIVSTTNANYGALRYTRAIQASDLSFSAVGNDVVTGGALGGLTNHFDTVTNGTVEVVTLRDVVAKEATSKRFYQLRVRLLYP